MVIGEARGKLIAACYVLYGELDLYPRRFSIPSERSGLRGRPFKFLYGRSRRFCSRAILEQAPHSNCFHPVLNSFKRQLDSTWEDFSRSPVISDPSPLQLHCHLLHYPSLCDSHTYFTVTQNCIKDIFFLCYNLTYTWLLRPFVTYFTRDKAKLRKARIPINSSLRM